MKDTEGKSTLALKLMPLVVTAGATGIIMSELLGGKKMFGNLFGKGKTDIAELVDAQNSQTKAISDLYEAKLGEKENEIEKLNAEIQRISAELKEVKEKTEKKVEKNVKKPKVKKEQPKAEVTAEKEPVIP